MAIIIEQDKKSINWIAIITGTIITISVFVGAYFLFFKSPEIIEATISTKLQDTQAIASTQFNPDPILKKIQEEFTVKPDTSFTSVTPGRENPFQQF